MHTRIEFFIELMLKILLIRVGKERVVVVVLVRRRSAYLLRLRVHHNMALLSHKPHSLEHAHDVGTALVAAIGMDDGAMDGRIFLSPVVEECLERRVFDEVVCLIA